MTEAWIVDTLGIVQPVNAMLLNMTIDFLINAMFKSEPMETLNQDRALIQSLGGPSKVAELLALPKKGGLQRVQNWLTRGIPPAVKVQRPDLFMPHLAADAPTDRTQPATESVAGQEV